MANIEQQALPINKPVEQESRMSASLMGHFRQYYPVDQDVIDKTVGDYRDKFLSALKESGVRDNGSY